MKTKLVRLGKEQAVVVDPALLEKLGIETRRAEPGPAKARVPRPAKPPQRPTPRDPKYGFPKKQPW